MITDEERREVAERIRERLREGKDKYLDALIGNAMSGCVPDGMTFGQTVADLIDRPTCHLIEDEDGYTACSECGCTALCMRDATYCPACGRVIVDD